MVNFIVKISCDYGSNDFQAKRQFHDFDDFSWFWHFCHIFMILTHCHRCVPQKHRRFTLLVACFCSQGSFSAFLAVFCRKCRFAIFDTCKFTQVKTTSYKFRLCMRRTRSVCLTVLCYMKASINFRVLWKLTLLHVYGKFHCQD